MILDGRMGHDDALVNFVGGAPDCVFLAAKVSDLETGFCVTHDSVMGDAAVVATEIDDCRLL